MAREHILPVFVPHLGCPNACVFCDQKRISGSLLPARPEDVTAEVDAARRRGLRNAQLAFYGGSFTAIPAREQEALLAAAAPGLADGTLASLRLSTRPDAVDGAILARLKAFGVSTVELGAQSMDDSVLKAAGRGHTAADVENAAGLVKQAGFALILQMMTGLPGSDDDSDVATARRLAALRPDGVRIYPTVIVRGTPLFDLWQAGRYRERTVEDAVRVCVRILPVFGQAGIPVIRLGLNPTAALSNADAAGGGYHPALGELVRSELLLGQARALLRGTPAGSRVTLFTAPGRVSAMTGQHRRNLDILRAEFALSDIRVRAAALPEDKILVDAADE